MDEFRNTCLVGDARAVLAQVPASTARMCCTSPPYWGLRDYGHGGQIGLEQTPEEYTAQLVEVFRQVRRVLRDDGTLWVNLGDSYSRSKCGGRNDAEKMYGSAAAHEGLKPRSGLKPKDLVGIPWRVAFALQADGWYLRSDIIWAKPNPMPESVTDRPTKAHEYVFLLSKSPRYFYDADAIKEDASTPGGRAGYSGYSARAKAMGREPSGNEAPGAEKVLNSPHRNKRTVWTVTPKPYAGAHFACWPPALVTPMILAGSRVGDLVLDPFMGSGTTAQVAQDLGRDWLGCELNPEYLELQKKRTAQMGLLGMAGDRSEGMKEHAQ